MWQIGMDGCDNKIWTEMEAGLVTSDCHAKQTGSFAMKVVPGYGQQESWVVDWALYTACKSHRMQDCAFLKLKLSCSRSSDAPSGPWLKCQQVSY